MRTVHSVNVGNCVLDGKKIYIQSMMNMPAGDTPGNVRQAMALESAGCDIIRAAIPNMEAVRLIPAIRERVNIPLVADIHFDYRLALESAAAGADKIRINPGNIGDTGRVRRVAKACMERGIPIRIGVNSGSLEKDILAKYGSPTPEALVESALSHARLLEQCDFNDIVISIKSSDVVTMIKGYRLLAERTNYPLHLGVTEAGTMRMGIIKSAVGIGALLAEGIGETVRVSLTADPVEEVRAARDILSAVGRGSGVRLISCPTCGRTKIDLVKLAGQVEEAVRDIPLDITVAVMGCAVNGPGRRERLMWDLQGDGAALIFRKGEIVRRVSEGEALGALMEEINNIQGGCTSAC